MKPGFYTDKSSNILKHNAKLAFVLKLEMRGFKEASQNVSQAPGEQRWGEREKLARGGAPKATWTALAPPQAS